MLYINWVLLFKSHLKVRMLNTVVEYNLEECVLKKIEKTKHVPVPRLTYDVTVPFVRLVGTCGGERSILQ